MKALTKYVKKKNQTSNHNGNENTEKKSMIKKHNEGEKFFF